jgi:hypothetical protein
VQKELEENVDKLPKTSASNIGQVSMAAGYAMLAELYLNAEKWSGKAMNDECIAAVIRLFPDRLAALEGLPTA